MTVAEIQIFGSEVYLIPTSAPKGKLELSGAAENACGRTAYLLPSLCCDAGVLITDTRNGELTLPIYLRCAIAAAVFLRRIRGLPLDEIDVETPVGHFTVGFDRSTLYPRIKAQKCKLLFSNYRETAQNVEVISNIYSTEIGRIKLIRCRNTSTFSCDALRQLSHGEQDTDLAATVAYSHDCDRATLTSVSALFSDADLLPYVAGALGTELSDKCGETKLEVSLRGEAVNIERKDGYTAIFCPDIRYSLFESSP